MPSRRRRSASRDRSRRCAGERLSKALGDQVELDIEAFVRVGGSLRDADRDDWRRRQTAAYREAFVHAGVVHPRFRAVVEQHFDPGGATLAAFAQEFAPISSS